LWLAAATLFGSDPAFFSRFSWPRYFQKMDHGYWDCLGATQQVSEIIFIYQLLL
jgi:hypothetical protein